MTGDKTKLRFQKSLFWSFWSSTTLILVITLLIYDTYRAITVPRGVVEGLGTVLFAQLVHDVFGNLAGFCIQVVGFCKKEDLKSLALCSSRIDHNLHVNVPYFWTCPQATVMLILSIFSSGMIIAGFVLFTDGVHVTPLASTLLTLRTVTDMLLSVDGAVLFAYLNRFARISLEIIFRDVPDVFTNNFGKILKHECNSNTFARFPSKPLGFDSKSEPGFNNGVHPKILDYWSPLVDFQGIERSILAIYEMIWMINLYYQIPVLFCVAKNVIGLLVSLYYCSLWNILLPAQKIVAVAILVSSSTLIIYLNNIPMEVKAQVREFFFVKECMNYRNMISNKLITTHIWKARLAST